MILDDADNQCPFSFDFENIWSAPANNRADSGLYKINQKENNRSFMPDFCDGPKSIGSSRLIHNCDPFLNREYDDLFESHDIGMEIWNNWLNLNDLFDHKENTKNNIQPLSVKSYNDTKSSHINLQIENKRSKIKITEWPKSNELIGKIKINNGHKSQEYERRKTANSYGQKELSAISGSINPFEKQPSQSSKTITQSFTEEFGSNLNNSNSKRDKARLKRGTTTQYLINNSPEEIVDNTLTGFVIKHIRENGPQSFDTLLWLVSSKYQSLRKLSGHIYTGNISKALKGTLTANGLFQEIKFASLQVNENVELQHDPQIWQNENLNNQPIVSYWNIIENAVEEYLNEKIKIVSDKRSKVINKSSYKIEHKEQSEQDLEENGSIERLSLSKPSIKSNRETKFSNK